MLLQHIPFIYQHLRGRMLQRNALSSFYLTAEDVICIQTQAENNSYINFQSKQKAIKSITGIFSAKVI